MAAVYTPDAGLCGEEGSSVLYGLNFTTGVPSSYSPPFGDSSGIVIDSISLGAGMAASPSLHIIYDPRNPGAGGKAIGVFTQSSTGAIIKSDTALAAPVSSGEVSWRELHK